MILKAKITESHYFNWYADYLDCVFYVDAKSKFGYHNVLDNHHNRRLLTDKNHLSRIAGGLTIATDHVLLLELDSNQGAKFLLETEVK